MALSKSTLKSALKSVFDNKDNTASSAQSQIKDAIVAYLGGATISLSLSAVTFGSVSFTLPSTSSSNTDFGDAIASAVNSACAAPLGDLAGLPAYGVGGVLIVSEIGAYSPMSGFTLPNSGASNSAASTIANAIHDAVSAITFAIITNVPAPPAVPVPTPVVDLPIL